MAGPILLAFISIVYCLYLSRRHLDVMMAALKNSRYIINWGPIWRAQGWFGGYVLTNRIAGMVVCPKVYVRYGEVTAAEIEDFPKHLKRRLTVYLVMLTTACIWMAVAYLLIKFR